MIWRAAGAVYIQMHTLHAAEGPCSRSPRLPPQVSGSVGISPTKSDRNLKPAGWPVDDCDVAAFASA